MNIQKTVFILIFHTTSFPWENGFPPNDHTSDHPTPMFDFNVPEFWKKFLSFDLSFLYTAIENIFISEIAAFVDNILTFALILAFSSLKC